MIGYNGEPQPIRLQEGHWDTRRDVGVQKVGTEGGHWGADRRADKIMLLQNIAPLSQHEVSSLI